MKESFTKIATPDNRFHNGDLETGEPGTIVTAEWLNEVQDHLLNLNDEHKALLREAGININSGDSTQLLKAVKKLIDSDSSFIKKAKISSSVNNNSTTDVASAKAVKTAYDKALDAFNDLDLRVLKSDFEIQNVTNANANDILKNGIYCISSMVSSVNFPEDAHSGNLLVIKGGAGSDNYLQQVFFEHYTGVIFYRYRQISSFEFSTWEQILTSKKLSNAIDSESDSSIATPKAVKTANDNANNRVSKNGDTMTGGLTIRAGDYSKLILENSGKSGLMLENAPESAGYFGILAERITNATRATIRLPRKSGEVVLDTSFKQSNQKNGWCKLPNGLILQWRECAQTEKVQTFWYPISFNTACYFVALTDNSIGTIPKLAETGPRTKTTVTIRHADGDVTAGQFFMFAIGF